MQNETTGGLADTLVKELQVTPRNTLSPPPPGALVVTTTTEVGTYCITLRNSLPPPPLEEEKRQKKRRHINIVGPFTSQINKFYYGVGCLVYIHISIH